MAMILPPHMSFSPKIPFTGRIELPHEYLPLPNTTTAHPPPQKKKKEYSSKGLQLVQNTLWCLKQREEIQRKAIQDSFQQCQPPTNR
ncbi:hypothetical protein HanRHA438_Chr15g0688231 [Helianthus annuus]|nr:hypothetical protein HanRHA438_Chr15g0688231 [Helianthus annuus]